MIKVLLIFLIFALTSNTKGFASSIDSSLSIAPFPVSPSNYDSTALSASSNKIHASGKLIGYCISTHNISCVIPLKIRGVQECASSFHPAKKLSSPGSAIASPGSYSLTLNYVSIDSIQQFKVSSNNLSDIFIPPK